MKKYLSVYKVLLQLNLSVFIGSKEKFFNNTLSSTLWGLFPFINVYLWTNKSKTFYSWSSDELFLLTAYFTLLIGIVYGLFGRSFKRFALLTKLGDLDSTLLKPLDSQFLISVWHFNYSNIIRILVGLVILLYMVYKLQLNINSFTLLIFLCTTFSSVLFFYSLWYSILTLTVWFYQLSNLRDLLITINSIARFPSEMFQNIFLLLICFPLSLMVAGPTKLLLHKMTTFEVGLLLSCSLSFFIFSRFFWRRALRSYTSAGG